MFTYVHKIQQSDVNVTPPSMERNPNPLGYIIPETSRRASRLSHNKVFAITGRQPRLSRTIRSASFEMVRKWNSLPADAVNSTSIDSFIDKLKKLEDTH